MTMFSITIEIAAPPAGVADHEGRRALARVDRIHHQRPAAGRGAPEGGESRGGAAAELPPARWMVTEVEEGTQFTWVSRAPGVLVTARHGVEPSGPARARRSRSTTAAFRAAARRADARDHRALHRHGGGRAQGAPAKRPPPGRLPAVLPDRPRLLPGPAVVRTVSIHRLSGIPGARHPRRDSCRRPSAAQHVVAVRELAPGQRVAVGAQLLHPVVTRDAASRLHWRPELGHRRRRAARRGVRVPGQLHRVPHDLVGRRQVVQGPAARTKPRSERARRTLARTAGGRPLSAASRSAPSM